jgi:acetyl esterase/lipase
MAKTRRFFRKKRWIIPGISIVLILLVFVIGQFTPVITAYLMKPLINHTKGTPPKNMETIKSQVNVVKNLVYEPRIDNSLMDIYYPKNAESQLPVILFTFGGGFIGNSKEYSQNFGMALANEGFVVANIDYALAPKHKYPTPIIQANEALHYLQEHIGQYHGDKNRIFLGGDSSGAQIASQTAAVITNQVLAKTMKLEPFVNQHQLKGVLLYCGAYNFDTLRAAHAFMMDTFIWAYTGEKNYEAWARIDEMSTVKQVTPDYPPVFLTDGNKDRLEQQTKELADVLIKNNVEVESVLYDDTDYNLGHDYQFIMDTAPAQMTFEKTVAFLKKHS